MMVAVAILALVGDLLIQQGQQTRREAELNKQLVLAKALTAGHENMREFLGDMGIVIARGATEAEVLRVTGRYQPLLGQAPVTTSLGCYPVTPSGEMLHAIQTRRITGELLDPHNYMYQGSFDFRTRNSGYDCGGGMSRSMSCSASAPGI
jgi:hypothetical protein